MQQVLALFFSVFIVASTLALPAPQGESLAGIGRPWPPPFLGPPFPQPYDIGNSGGLKDQLINQVSTTYLSE